MPLEYGNGHEYGSACASIGENARHEANIKVLPAGAEGSWYGRKRGKVVGGVGVTHHRIYFRKTAPVARGFIPRQMDEFARARRRP